MSTPILRTSDVPEQVHISTRVGSPVHAGDGAGDGVDGSVRAAADVLPIMVTSISGAHVAAAISLDAHDAAIITDAHSCPPVDARATDGAALSDVRAAAGTDAPSPTEAARDPDLGVIAAASVAAGTGVAARTAASVSASADTRVSLISVVVKKSARAHAPEGVDIRKGTRFSPRLLLRGTRVRANTGARRRQVSTPVRSCLNTAGYTPSLCDDAVIQQAIHDNLSFIASPVSSPLVTPVTKLWLNRATSCP